MSKDPKSTPMLEQYWRLKKEQPQAILLFRLGDFYEMFEDDAILAAPLLEVQLTSRDGRIPMCGVPHHAVNQYVTKLLNAGHTVAIAEQMEDPQVARGLVDRQIVRVVTPGTVVPDDDSKSPRLAILWRHRGGWVMVVVELSIGKLHVVEGSLRVEHVRQLLSLWEVWRPDEYLSNWERDLPAWSMRVPIASYMVRMDHRALEQMVAEKLGAASMRRWGLEERFAVHEALAVLWRYLDATQKRAAGHLVDVVVHSLADEMVVGERTSRQLDLIEGPYSLYERINATCTPMGARQLKEWLQHPLIDASQIAQRSRAVEYWVKDSMARAQVRDSLKEVGDLSRRVARIVLGMGRPRDVIGIYDAICALPTIIESVGKANIWRFAADLDLEVLEILKGSLGVIETAPLPAHWDDLPLIKNGVDPSVDGHRLMLENQRKALLELEDTERDRSGIKSLKVGYHRTFGYYLEVLRSQSATVPPDWQRRQSTTHSERFSSESLRLLEEAIRGAEEDVRVQEALWAERLQELVKANAAPLTQWAHWVAEVDVLVGLAETAVRLRHCAPYFHAKSEGTIMRGLRHPVLEGLIPEYVVSDLALEEGRTTVIITGPNMGGKSTFMRALAQNAILAQIGGFVAASEYCAPLFDAIYTRVGADDDLARGQSTFMVEMEEVAAILSGATANSLVVLDELGRGTSTYDGLAIARAVIERLARSDGPITFFATHYHELTSLAPSHDRIINLTVEVDESPSGLVFTHRVVPGYASKSYGLEVARLAGIPGSVIRRAESLLRTFEPTEAPIDQHVPQQLSFYTASSSGEDVVVALDSLDPDELSPREAWAWIEEWKHRLRDAAKGARS